MVESVEQYEWSSFSAKVGLVECNWLDLDPCYLSLADRHSERMMRYKVFVDAGIEQSEQDFIQTAVERNQLTGSHRFVDEVENRLGMRVEFRGRGRPSKGRAEVLGV